MLLLLTFIITTPGSNRVGIKNSDLVLTSVLNNFIAYNGVYLVGSYVSTNTPALSATAMKHTMNMKVYELSNHLGNVLVTVSDARQILNTGASVTGYAAIVTSATDYSAFGAPMVGRTYQSASYRYGFNGTEKVDEITGSTGMDYDFGERILDTRLGRWLSIDPLEKLYPEFSPYCFAANSPIQYLDKQGKGFNGGFSVENQSTEPITIVGSAGTETQVRIKGDPQGPQTYSHFEEGAQQTITLQPGQRYEAYAVTSKNEQGEDQTYYTGRVVQFAQIKDGKLVPLTETSIVNNDVQIWDVDYIQVQEGQTFVNDGQNYNTNESDKNAVTPNPPTGTGTIKLQAGILDYFPDADDANEGKAIITGNKSSLKIDDDAGEGENNPSAQYGDGVPHN